MMMRDALVVVLSIVGMGCGECMPKTATLPTTYHVSLGQPHDGAIAHSADELRALLASVQILPAQDPPGMVAAGDPAAHEAQSVKSQRDDLDAFVAGTSFTTNDVALVHAGGGERAVLMGQSIDHARVTLYFGGTCSPCGGGAPGSYYAAASADDAARAERTELVRVPKGARVEVHQCTGGSCPTCRNDIP